MKKVFINLIASFVFMFGVYSVSNALSVLNVDTASAAEFQVSLTMDYPEAPDDLAGYNIYLNDQIVETINSETPVTSWGSIIDLTPGSNTFAVTAFDDANQESPKGNSVTHNPPPATGPQIIDMEVTSTTTTP